MTSRSFNTTQMLRTTADALQEGTFDPLARQIDGYGRSYVDFHAVANGETDPEDPCNVEIDRLVKQGRSEAFCREYRVGWHLSYQATRGQSLAATFRANPAQGPAGPQAIREAFKNWKPGFNDRRLIAETAEKRAKEVVGPPPEEPVFTARALARAAGALDYGQLNPRIVSA